MIASDGKMRESLIPRERVVRDDGGNGDVDGAGDDDGACAFLLRLFGKRVRVKLCARECDEEIARSEGARVGRDAGKMDVVRHFPAEICDTDSEDHS